MQTPMQNTHVAYIYIYHCMGFMGTVFDHSLQAELHALMMERACRTADRSSFAKHGFLRLAKK